MYYYKVQTVTNVTPQNIKACDSLGKYLILHQGASAWQFSKYGLHDDMLTGELSALPDSRWQYKTNNPDRGNRYKWIDRQEVLDQVHLYLVDSLVPKFNTGDDIKISLTAIGKAEIYKKAKGRTTTSWVVPAIVGPVLAAGAFVGLVALTKSSCPLVYVKNQDDYAFAGEIFGGAICASLERHDYLPLPGFEPRKNRYELKITNGLPEIQYINSSELWIVSHPENLTVLPDRQGVVHTIKKQVFPAEAISSSKSDILPLIRMKDRNCFQFDETPSLTGDTCAFNTAILSFQIPANADTGKLLISAGNSTWGDYTFGEFTKLFGKRYEEYMRWQGKRPPEKNLQWKMDQRLALMVYLETNAGWEFVDYFDLIGPLGARDLIMAVDLKRALLLKTPDGGRLIRMKLETGFKLWDLDYVAMDFSRDIQVRVDYVQPTAAKTETGKDIVPLLSKNDAKYYVQEKIGEEGFLVFQDSPEVRGMKKSVFLHTKGYYTHVRNYPNPPDRKKLQTFYSAGRFSRFSCDNYAEFVKNKLVFISDPRVP